MIQQRGPLRTPSTTLRNRYVSDAVDTMSPARLVIALYDRVMLDFDRAVEALAENDVTASHHALVHAQEIVSELHDSLDVEMWPAGAQLGEVYRYVIAELIAANVTKNARRVAACRLILEPLRDAWREASGVLPNGPGGRAT